MNISLWLSAIFTTTAFSGAVAGYETISDQYDCFRSMDGMMESMEDLANEHPSLVTIGDIGDSYLKKNPGGQNGDYGIPTEGYDIHAIKITASGSPSNEKGKMLITSGVHSREWATPELLARFIEMLVNGYDEDADITWILQHTEIHAILYVNPDGRYMAEKYPDLYWRKNMNPNGRCGDDSYGVDINRNMDFMWAFQDGSSNDPCESDFHGSAPESEPETKALADYARALFPKGQRKNDPEGDKDVPFGEDITGMYVDIHSSGGYVYYPWGHKDSQSPDDEALQALGRKMNYFNDYLLWAGGQEDFLYAASGDISDWMYGVLGVASMGFEIGDDWQQNCNLFEKKVVPINLPALLYAAKTAAKPFKEIKGPDVFDLEAGTGNGQIEVTARVSDGEMVNQIQNFPDHTSGAQKIQSVQLYVDIHPDDYQPNSNSGSRFEMQAVTRRLQSTSCASIDVKKVCKRFGGCEWRTTSETCISATSSSASPAQKPTINNESVVCSNITRKNKCNRAGEGEACSWDTKKKQCKPASGGSSGSNVSKPDINTTVNPIVSNTPGNFGSGDETVSLAINTNTLPNGRHVLFVQATDSDGYKGPVSSIFVDVSSRRLRGSH